MKRGRAACVALAALAAAGCGGGSSSSSSGGQPTSQSPGPAATLKISADPSQLKFNTGSLTAKAGKVTITMANPSPLSHDVSIKGGDVDQTGNVVGKGGTSTVTATLKPGTYTFYCSVDAHEAAGMKGTLTVK